MTKKPNSNSSIVASIHFIDKKLDFLAKNTIVSLFIIGSIALFLRVYYFPTNIPLTLDAYEYFSYAIDISILGHFPIGYHFPNNGWPAFLSIFFLIFHSNNFLDYMNLQRLVTVSISVLTIIPVYLLCNRFFDKSYALVGAALFAFEPRIIQNSLLGTTDPLYIILVTITLFLFLSNNKKAIYFSFGITALCALVRYEGLILFFVLSVMFFLRYRKERRVIAKYALAISIFVLLLIPMVYVRMQTIGSDGLTSHIIAGGENTLTLSANENGKGFGLALFLVKGLTNLVKYLGWISIPIFIFFVPIGAILILKNRNYNTMTIILSIFVLLIPALYAYSREFQDTRYLYVLYPLFCILAIFTIKRLGDKIKNHNTLLVLIVGGILLSSSIFLDLKKTDYEHQREAFSIAQYVTNTTKVINGYYPESSYYSAAALSGLQRFPVLMNTVPPPTNTLNIEAKSLDEYIKIGKSMGLSYILIDDNNNRPSFLKDVFYHEEKYTYLEKRYDSSDYSYKYHVKIYKINYDEFAQQ
jgi:hypothetical protein